MTHPNNPEKVHLGQENPQGIQNPIQLWISDKNLIPSINIDNASFKTHIAWDFQISKTWGNGDKEVRKLDKVQPLMKESFLTLFKKQTV